MSTFPEKLHISVSRRAMVMFSCGLFFFFVVALRLWFLMVIRGEEFRIKSENNRIRRVYIPPPRGLILDRDGKVLVKNRASFNIEFIKEDSDNPDQTIKNLAKLVEQPEEVLLSRLKENKKRRRFEPKLLLKDVSRDLMAKVVGNRYLLPGVIVNVVPLREYVHQEAAAHVLGYIREITSSQLEQKSYAEYQQGDIVGQFGLEKKWERLLQGQRGLQAIVVDATGNRIGEASFDTEVAGHNLTTTIDMDVQLAAEKALGDRKGAVVAQDPNTGEILAIVSHPAFNPNDFAKELSIDQWKDLVEGKDKKLNNRATQGVYPPGSVFKVFMAVAGLEESVFTPNTTISCPGFFPFVGRNFRCHKRTGHGPVNLFSALVMSCDVYFYTLGNRLGIDRIHKYASMFGLGEKTGFDVNDESLGIIPSTAWKKSYFKTPENQKWYAGETLSVVIGQGATTTTPLQLNRAVAAAVNGGKLYKPYIEKKVESVDGTFLDDTMKPVEQGKIEVNPETLAKVKEAMIGVVHDPHGTGKKASLEKEFGIKAGGKTGTAQVAALEFHRKGSNLDHHAWYSGFAPADNPQIVVTALVENGGGGGAAAAPVVKEAMMAFFQKRLPRIDNKNVEQGSNTYKSGTSVDPEALEVPSADTPLDGYQTDSSLNLDLSTSDTHAD